MTKENFKKPNIMTKSLNYGPKAKGFTHPKFRILLLCTLRKLRKYGIYLPDNIAYQPQFTLHHIFCSYLGSFIGIAALAYLTTYTHYPLIAAPFGASAVLLFGVPESPLAQPRNVIGGNCLGAIAAIVLVHFFGTEPWVEALAVATAIKLMQLTKTVHPPAGAVALIGVMSSASPSFFWTPVFIGSIILVICACCFNNTLPKRTYPKHWL